MPMIYDNGIIETKSKRRWKTPSSTKVQERMDAAFINHHLDRLFFLLFFLSLFLSLLPMSIQLWFISVCYHPFSAPKHIFLVKVLSKISFGTTISCKTIENVSLCGVCIGIVKRKIFSNRTYWWNESHFIMFKRQPHTPWSVGWCICI